MAQNLVSLEEAANRLGVSVDAVKKLREDGNIFGVRDGASWKFKTDELARYKAEMAGDLPVPGGAMDDDFDLADDLKSDSGTGKNLDVVDLDAGSGSESTVHLGADALDEDELVLGGSGIDLEKASDSGISLEEEPLQLAGDSSAGSGDFEALQSDDEFNLTPMLELDDESSEASGSQVIALDSEEGFSDSGGLMGSDSFSDPLGAPMMGQGMLADVSPQAGFGQAGAMMPAVAQTTTTRFGALSVTGMALSFLALAFTGYMLVELTMHMWAWTEPTSSFSGWALETFFG